MQKAGLKYEGTFKQDPLKWGVYEDIGLCGLVRAEYAAPADLTQTQEPL